MAVGFIYVTKRHFAKTLIGLIILLALFFAFGFAKSAFASSVPDDKQSTIEEVIQASEPIVEEVSEPEPTETPYNCTSIANFDDNIKQWCQLIDDYADDYNLDPVLIASVIQVESKGNPDAVSSMKAIGLMQVMPSDSGYPIFHQRPVSSDLFNPAINIDWGCKILAGYIETYGSIREGLLHYGPIDYGYIYADQVLALYEEKSS
ncbi:MAG TPA: transglycosylase SLT domain-containing protein [Spirochaetia bacterium]|nr:transglycosylase SLT domain-containing protein [Spirochaetia bacterium]